MDPELERLYKIVLCGGWAPYIADVWGEDENVFVIGFKKEGTIDCHVVPYPCLLKPILTE